MKPVAQPKKRRQKKKINTIPPEGLHRENIVYVYTDGSSSIKAGSDGGWCFYATCNGQSVLNYGYKLGTTNNEQELTAIRNSLLTIRVTEYPIWLYTDSQYCRDAITTWHKTWRLQGWKTATGSPVKNQELIEHIVELIDIHREAGEVRVLWVRGHGDGEGHSYYNNLVDKWASHARRERVIKTPIPE
jgi:ribonuclease HI